MENKELDQYLVRKKKLENLRKLGFNPYPSCSDRTHSIKKLLIDFENLSKSDQEVIGVGRLKSIRGHGGSLFANIEDGTDQIQIYLKKDLIGKDQYKIFTDNFDIGDFIEISGVLFKTKKGEITIKVSKFKILSKSLYPMPEKWHGLSDTEIRFRKRYLDLIANPEIRLIFKKRSVIISAIREFLDQNNFLEVDTPILQSIPGGANAKPFSTHHNALNIDLFLRIAPELFLKRLIIGGFEKVYEISRCFRNEGIDHAHNPEFTEIEFYWAYADYEKLMKFTEKLITYIIKKLDLNLIIEYQGRKIDFNPPYERITFKNALEKYAKINLDKCKNEKELLKAAKKTGLKLETGLHKAAVLDDLFKKVIRPNLIAPTFVTDYPIELSPLSKIKEDNPDYTERFQLVAGGTELINAFSELNDPMDQKSRFEAQEELRKKGDQEAQRIDWEFIEALSYGMPPTAGFGMGIDRLTALLTDLYNIKEVILFPTLKPKDGKK